MSGWNDADTDELQRLSTQVASAERALERQVAFCRQAGMPWQVIADCLGVSKQAAHKRFRAERVSFEDRQLPL